MSLVRTRGTARTTRSKKKEFVRGRAHAQTVDWFWSNVKGSIRGTHKSVSPKHLQSYLDGFVFHYNNAGADREAIISS